MAKSRVTFPDGTTVDIAKDTPPEQIRAILATLASSQSPVPQVENETGKVIQPQLSAEEIWEHGSKKEKVALFVRNHFLPNQWFTTIDVRDEQLTFVKRLVFGESSAIATYLNRLYEEGYLQKMKRIKMSYQITKKILEEYPPLELHQVSELMQRG